MLDPKLYRQMTADEYARQHPEMFAAAPVWRLGVDGVFRPLKDDESKAFFDRLSRMDAAIAAGVGKETA